MSRAVRCVVISSTAICRGMRPVALAFCGLGRILLVAAESMCHIEISHDDSQDIILVSEEFACFNQQN
ncbi:hypothetical protein [Ralstonia phage RSL2]|uniref:Uncharacterized protein n=1 Tax=Ralstonia phage RSL2 TaxID=1585840 RepID=A0A146I5H4_9CAUD|nr:hypothetical protein [Ralstonia phage RSL2]